MSRHIEDNSFRAAMLDEEIEPVSNWPKFYRGVRFAGEMALAAIGLVSLWLIVVLIVLARGG